MINYNWLPLLGDYQLEDNIIIYNGSQVIGENGETIAGVGNLIFDKYFNEGIIKAEIEFEDTNLIDGYGCDIILNYKNTDTTPEMLCVGIDKGKHTMFELKSFRNFKWEFHKFSGESKAFKVNQRYFIEVEYKGNLVKLKINGINVLEGIVPFSTTTSQVGIWSRSSGRIKIYNYEIHATKPKAFVVMQFSQQFNELYQDVIKSICDKYSIEAVRADDIYNNGMIIHDITSNINEAKVIIADVTSKNPNVYYEVGYSHALSKPTILLAEEGTELPFDVKPYRVIFYTNSIGGKKNVEEKLDIHLKQII